MKPQNDDNDSSSEREIINITQSNNLPNENNVDVLENTITDAINTKNNEQANEESSKDDIVDNTRDDTEPQILQKKQISNHELPIVKSPGYIANIKSGIISIFSYIIGPVLGIFSSRNNKTNIENDKDNIEDDISNDNQNDSVDNSELSGENDDSTETSE